jgi:magnesium chelatase subunit I
MNIESIKTFGQLKAAGFEHKTVKEELRRNLLQRLMKKETTFVGIHGYEYTVIPELERAILSKHNINLLGLRGQAKTRLARQMIGLLDEYVPVVAGSEINDDPFHPISRHAR